MPKGCKLEGRVRRLCFIYRLGRISWEGLDTGRRSKGMRGSKSTDYPTFLAILTAAFLG
jgi:hypothetical protein